MTDAPTIDELLTSLMLEMKRNPSPATARLQIICTTFKRELDKKADKETT